MIALDEDALSNIIESCELADGRMYFLGSGLQEMVETFMLKPVPGVDLGQFSKLPSKA